MTPSSSIASEQGFASWTRLKAYAEPSPRARHTRIFVPDMQWIGQRVDGLLRTRQWEVPAALEQIREWHPRFPGVLGRARLAARPSPTQMPGWCMRGNMGSTPGTS